MSDDGGLRPRLSRYNSVMPGTSPTGTAVGPTAAGTQLFIPVPSDPAGMASRNVSAYVPPGFRYVGARPGGILVERIGGSTAARPTPRVYGPTVQESEQYVRQQAAFQTYQRAVSDYNVGRFSRGSRTLNGVQVENGQTTPEQTQQVNANADVNSVFGPLNIDAQINPENQFIFDRAAPLTDLDGGRVGVLASHGIYGSADSMERQLPAGTDVKPAPSENRMTVGGVVKWFRGLSVRDKAAYNQLVVMLRNAGYLTGGDEDLPMNGYSTVAGIAIAQAANDLSQANDAGDDRTMMEYLGDRGKAYEDYLKQTEADKAKEEEYQPIDRQYADPASLKAAAYDAARAAIGRKLTDEEEARLQEAFRAKEDSTYDTIDEAGRNETSYKVAAPDISGQVDDFLDGDEFELERKRVLIGDYANEFMRMMGVSG